MSRCLILAAALSLPAALPPALTAAPPSVSEAAAPPATSPSASAPAATLLASAPARTRATTADAATAPALITPDPASLPAAAPARTRATTGDPALATLLAAVPARARATDAHPATLLAAAAVPATHGPAPLATAARPASASAAHPATAVPAPVPAATLLAAAAHAPASTAAAASPAVAPASAPATGPGSPLWTEDGYQATETRTWNSTQVTAWRFSDPTGAFAAWQASPDRDKLVHSGNYVLSFNGPRPDPNGLEELTSKLPNRTTSPLPPVLAHLPEKGRVPGSERYALGPVGLSLWEPRVSRELASFERGAESETARYRQNGSDLTLTIFAYPTPQLAIERYRHFEKLGGAEVKRSGTLIAVVPDARGNTLAKKLLAGIEYRPNITWNEYVPKNTPQDAAKMILAISVLAAGLIIASLFLGLFFGGGKILARRFGMKGAEEDFTSLHIGQ